MHIQVTSSAFLLSVRTPGQCRIGIPRRSFGFGRLASSSYFFEVHATARYKFKAPLHDLSGRSGSVHRHATAQLFVKEITNVRYYLAPEGLGPSQSVPLGKSVLQQLEWR